jgi:hypothetical protein
MDTIAYETYTIEIESDEDAESPREWDNLGEILYTPTRYKLGDRRTDADEIEAIMADDNEIWLPVYAYIHSGVALSTGNAYPFNDRWDADMCGIIHVSKDIVRKEYGKQRISRKLYARIESLLRSEIEELNQYLQGDVYCYSIQDESGDVIDSCCGLYGYDYCVEQARESARYNYERAYHQAALEIA